VIRVIFLLLGHAFVFLASLGLIFPLMPSIPFLVAAAWCYARGSKKLHDKLLANKVFGPTLRDWMERGVISFRAKMLSLVTITLSAFYGAYKFGLGTASLIYVILCALVLVFVLTRPSK
jgi:uncharacterized protein